MVLIHIDEGVESPRGILDLALLDSASKIGTIFAPNEEDSIFQLYRARFI